MSLAGMGKSLILVGLSTFTALVILGLEELRNAIYGCSANYAGLTR